MEVHALSRLVSPGQPESDEFGKKEPANVADFKKTILRRAGYEGFGATFTDLINNKPKGSGYAILSVTNEQSPDIKKLLKSFGFQVLDSFTNPRTGAKIDVFGGDVQEIAETFYTEWREAKRKKEAEAVKARTAAPKPPPKPLAANACGPRGDGCCWHPIRPTSFCDAPEHWGRENSFYTRQGNPRFT